jgi:hypothetical protein
MKPKGWSDATATKTSVWKTLKTDFHHYITAMQSEYNINGLVS